MTVNFYWFGSNALLVSRWYPDNTWKLAFIEHRPPCEVYRLDCLDTYGLDWIATHCVHPFNGFFCCGQVVEAVGLLEKLLVFLAWFPRLPFSPCLNKRDAVAAALILFANDNWLASARDQNICLFVDLHFFISEYGYVAIIGRLSGSHQ